MITFRNINVPNWHYKFSKRESCIIVGCCSWLGLAAAVAAVAVYSSNEIGFRYIFGLNVKMIGVMN